MASLPNHRKTSREELDRPILALISFEAEKLHTNLFVNILNLSVQGVLIKSTKNFKKNFELKLMVENYELKQWDSFYCRVAWRQDSDIENEYNIGLEFLFPVDISEDNNKKVHNGLSPEDLNFILNHYLIKSLSNKGVCPFLNCLIQKTIDPKIKLITQGEITDSLFIIQQGVCSIERQKDDSTITIAHKGKNDIIGEMALFNKDARRTSVISETEMILWQLPVNVYDKACQLNPDTRHIITQIIMDRLENTTLPDVSSVGQYIIKHPSSINSRQFIFKGLHKHINLPVTIKMATHKKALNIDFIRKFKQECKIISQLNHPNIVQIYNIKERYRTYFIIMENLEGELLNSLLKRKGRFEPTNAIHLLTQIAAGLAYAHDNKIIHKELKPSNIFITDENIIKLLNFGLSWAANIDSTDEDNFVHYMSPEQVNNDPLDYQSDIYSFGILAYEIITGQKPFSGKEVSNVKKMHANNTIPDPQILTPELPDSLSNLIIKSCAKSPNLRYDSMKEVLDKLTTISHSLKLKTGSYQNMANEKEVTTLLIPHEKEQELSLIKLLDEFSELAIKKGFSIKLVGKTKLS